MTLEGWHWVSRVFPLQLQACGRKTSQKENPISTSSFWFHGQGGRQTRKDVGTRVLVFCKPRSTISWASDCPSCCQADTDITYLSEKNVIFSKNTKGGKVRNAFNRIFSPQRWVTVVGEKLCKNAQEKFCPESPEKVFLGGIFFRKVSRIRTRNAPDINTQLLVSTLLCQSIYRLIFYQNIVPQKI